MIPALLGLITGGLTRLAPVVAEIVTLKEKNAHEFGQALAALQSAYQSVANTGVKWVDSINALIRPYYTVIFVNVWLAVKAATYYQLHSKGLSWDSAIVALWTDNDQALFSAIANFWFLGRVFDKALK